MVAVLWRSERAPVLFGFITNCRLAVSHMLRLLMLAMLLEPALWMNSLVMLNAVCDAKM